MWKKNEGYAPHFCIAIKLRGDEGTETINTRNPREWIWEITGGSGDIIEYDDGQAAFVRHEYRASKADFGFDIAPRDISHRIYPDSVEITPEGQTTIEQVRQRCEGAFTNKENYSGFPEAQPALRTFATGATRHTDTDKYDYEGFLSPVALEAFAAYMHVNRRTADGSLRDSDNWQKGIPVDAYMKSGFRHFLETWKAHRGHDIEEGELAAACGVLFNTMGWIHEKAKADPEWFERELHKFKQYRAAEIANRVQQS